MKKKLKKYWVSFCYSVPINYEGFVMAESEDDAVRKAHGDSNDFQGDFAEQPVWGEEAPDYKLNKKHPSDSVGVYVEESDEDEDEE